MIQNRTKVVTVHCILSLCLFANYSTAAEEKRPEVGKYAKVYKGDEGLRVIVLQIGPKEKSEALVQIIGIDHPWNGIIRKHNVISTQSKTDFTTKIDGKNWTTLTARQSWWNAKQYEVWLKGESNGRTVFYVENESKKVIPQHFLTEYLKQENKPKKK